MLYPVHGISIPLVLFRFAILAAFGLLAWRAFQPTHLFHIRISSTGLKMKKGVVSRRFLLELDGIRHEFQLRRGWVAGIGKGKAIRLIFSSNVPEDAKQRVRNLWMVHK
jgi:hypothetical protein